MCCEIPDLANYSSSTGIAELNLRAGSGYKTKCFFDTAPAPHASDPFAAVDQGYNSIIEVRMSQEWAKKFAAQPKLGKHGCRYQLNGKLYFAGQIDRSHPVMYLKVVTF